MSTANGDQLLIKGCTFANTTCGARLNSGYVLKKSSCRTCLKDLCNGVGTSAISVAALIFTIVLGVFGKNLMN